MQANSMKESIIEAKDWLRFIQGDLNTQIQTYREGS